MRLIIKTTEGVQVMNVLSGSAEDALEKWKAIHSSIYVSSREMPDDAIPSDREFRDAWVDTTSELVIDFDMPKARTIHLGRIRKDRNAKLALLDVDAIKAEDQSNSSELAQIREQKQVLRDIPQTIASDLAAATTIEELKEIKPL